MKTVLVLGGTNFIGRVLVEKLLFNPNYQLTLFNRGKRNAGIFAEVPQIHGDRETDDYLKIAEHNWDYIIDCSGYFPNSFEKLLNAVDGKVGRYIFISTISVFDLGSALGKGIDEDTPILGCTEEQKTSALPGAYGEKKAEMERLLLGHTKMDKVILRPSLVYGKYDFTDRFYYWLWRAKFTGKILLPDGGKDMISITYVDDLTGLVIAAMDAAKHNTVYNAATHRVTIKQMPETAARVMETTPQYVPVDGKKLLDAGVEPWQDIPLWLKGDLDIPLTKAEKDFNFTPTRFDDTVLSTINYYATLGWPPCKYGLTPEKEKELLAI